MTEDTAHSTDTPMGIALNLINSRDPRISRNLVPIGVQNVAEVAA